METVVLSPLSGTLDRPARAEAENHRHPQEAWWSSSREASKPEDKKHMGMYFAEHDFLVRDGDPRTDRETVASFIVNQGTTPNAVVEACLKWIESYSDEGPFFLTWYTPGHLVPTTLRFARESNRHLRTAAKLFLFPGEVDEETEAVSGPDAEKFATSLDRHFTYAILSAYSFDIRTGTVYFNSPTEVGLQRACATRFVAHTFLFLDSSKFKSEGEAGYTIGDLLKTSDKVTIYTVASGQDELIRNRFLQLARQLLHEPSPADDSSLYDEKTLRLQIVGCGVDRTQSLIARGVLARA